MEKFIIVGKRKAKKFTAGQDAPAINDYPGDTNAWVKALEEYNERQDKIFEIAAITRNCNEQNLEKCIGRTALAEISAENCIVVHKVLNNTKIHG
jgi:hypothetical protein